MCLSLAFKGKNWHGMNARVESTCGRDKKRGVEAQSVHIHQTPCTASSLSRRVLTRLALHQTYTTHRLRCI